MLKEVYAGDVVVPPPGMPFVDVMLEQLFAEVWTRDILEIRDRRLVFAIATETDDPVGEFQLSLGPFRQVVKDYFQICESYFEAVKTLPPSQIETIDMARRGIHNEGSRVLQERLEGKVEVDTDTARRLFTLICVLHFGG